MIDTLEKHGYVRRLPCETDSRVTYVELTPKGRGLRKDFEEISRVLRSKLYGDMSEKDRERPGPAIGQDRGEPERIGFFCANSS